MGSLQANWAGCWFWDRVRYRTWFQLFTIVWLPFRWQYCREMELLLNRMWIACMYLSAFELDISVIVLAQFEGLTCYVQKVLFKIWVEYSQSSRSWNQQKKLEIMIKSPFAKTKSNLLVLTVSYVLSQHISSPSRRTSPWGPKAQNELRRSCTGALVVLVCGLSEITSRWTTHFIRMMMFDPTLCPNDHR